MANIFNSINILDIVVVTVTILLLLFGIWRGMYKMVSGLISSIAALALAIVLISPVVTFTIDNTLLDDKLVEVIAQPLDKYVPGAQQVVALYDLDNNPDTPDELGYDPGTGPRPFEELLKGSRLAFMTNTLEGIVAKQVKEKGEAPFLEAVVGVITAYILSAAAFIVLWILMFIIFKVVFYLIKKAVTTTYLGYYINKILGGVLGLVIAVVLVFGFLTIVKLLGNYELIIPVNQMIDNSVVTKMLANNNFLYDFLAKNVDMQSYIDKIMAMIAKAGG